MTPKAISDFLGKDDAQAEESIRDSDHSASAVAAAIAIDQAGLDSARSFLDRHALLVQLQTDQFRAERPLRLSLLRSQDAARRLRFWFQIFLLLVATAGAAAVLAILKTAYDSNEVVVETFHAPPALAARGLSGEVLASQFLDALNRLQMEARGSAKARNLSGAWSKAVEINVPQTSISLSDLLRQLKRHLGHDLHYGGDLVENDKGQLVLSVRGDGLLAKSFSGDDLANLVRQAAEYVFGQAQPVVFAYGLIHSGRYEDAVNFSRAAVPTAAREDKPVLLNTWHLGLAYQGRPMEQSVALLRQALALKPDYWVPYNNLMLLYASAGQDEEAWKVGNEMRTKAGGRPGRAPEELYLIWDQVTQNLERLRAAQLADLDANGGFGSFINGGAQRLALIEIRLHDANGAEFRLNEVNRSANDPTATALSHWVSAMIALERGQNAKAGEEIDQYWEKLGDPSFALEYGGLKCWIVAVEESVGRPDKADLALRNWPGEYTCMHLKGDVLDHRGDWKGAQQAYEDAVAAAPDLPSAYLSWGAALARHEKYAEAALKLEAAHQRGPNWADPLKAWGDALAARGAWKEALAKYDAAVPLAPNWQALKDARLAAVFKTGGRRS